MSVPTGITWTDAKTASEVAGGYLATITSSEKWNDINKSAYTHKGYIIEYETNICNPVPSDMISWWKAENNGNDIIGINHGTLMNGVTFAIGKVGKAFSFDGVDDYVEMTGSNIGDFGNNPFTV